MGISSLVTVAKATIVFTCEIYDYIGKDYENGRDYGVIYRKKWKRNVIKLRDFN